MWIDIPPKDTTALVNETVELECKGRGNPAPTISWKKNDIAINFANNRRYLQMSTGSLRISLSQKSDTGKYTCVATNSAGYRWANATLSVLSKFFMLNYGDSRVTRIASRNSRRARETRRDW